MTQKSKRYLFIDFEDLQKVQFKKLEKVCNRIYIFISEKENSVPFEIVRKVQKFGKNAKWISVAEHLEEDMSFHICFTIGKMHEKVSMDIEFAVLSNKTIYDSIVNYINEEGRNCLRVKRQEDESYQEQQQEHQANDMHQIVVEENTAEEVTTYQNGSGKINGNSDVDEKAILKDIIIEDFEEKLKAINEDEVDEEIERAEVEPIEEEIALIEKTAEDTVRLLVHSGNRPSDISMLRSYILIHNKDLSYQGDLDKIINYLVAKKDIVLNKDEVKYNF